MAKSVKRARTSQAVTCDMCRAFCTVAATQMDRQGGVGGAAAACAAAASGAAQSSVPPRVWQCPSAPRAADARPRRAQVLDLSCCR
eukprot:3106467-Pyramimonas_sp.AAC.1